MTVDVLSNGVTLSGEVEVRETSRWEEPKEQVHFPRVVCGITAGSTGYTPVTPNVRVFGFCGLFLFVGFSI